MKSHEILNRYFISHRDEIVADFFRLIEARSVRSESVDGAPKGVNCKKTLELAVDMFRENGFCAEISADCLYATVRYGEGEGEIGLFAHSDVVPVDDKWKKTEPFSPVVDKGRLFGRGTSDNKNAIVFALYFMKGLRECGIKMKNSLSLFIGSNEESGMNDVEAFVKNEKMPDLCIVPDNDYPICLGEKGRSVVYCRAEKPFEDINNIFGGEAENIVLGEVTCLIKYSDELYEELLRVSDERYTVTTQGKEIKLMARGLSSHAAHPEKGINAMSVLCELLCKCKHLCANDKEILCSASSLLATVNGECFDSFCEDASFGVSTCANGKVSAPDRHLTLSFDIRYGVKISPDVLKENIEKALAPIGYGITFFDGYVSFEIPRESEHAQALMRAYREVTGESDADFFYSGGNTYARHLKNAFSIGMSRDRDSDYDDLGAGHGREHQPDEFINIDGFLEAMTINSAMILSCDEML